jgi:predicted nucleotidyltransferase
MRYHSAVEGRATKARRRAPLLNWKGLDEVVRLLRNAYRSDFIYLFGSQSRGEAGPDSDYDLLLVVNDDVPPEQRRSRLAYEVLRGTKLATDVLVCTRSYFEARRHLRASLPGTVLREGLLLHAE